MLSVGSSSQQLQDAQDIPTRLPSNMFPYKRPKRRTLCSVINFVSVLLLQSQEAHPRQPQLTHCRSSWPSLSSARGTLHMQVLLKFVSFVCTHRRQQSFSSVKKSNESQWNFLLIEQTNLLVALLLPFRDEHRISISILQQPVVQLFANGLFLVV